MEKRRPRRWWKSDDLVASGEATSSSLEERGLRGRLGGKLKGEPRMRQILWLTNEPFVKVVHGAIFLQATRRRFSTTSLLHETPLLHYAASPLGRRFSTWPPLLHETPLLHLAVASPLRRFSTTSLLLSTMGLRRNLLSPKRVKKISFSPLTPIRV